MPLYEYVCRACGRKFSWLVGVVADARAPTCDRCGAQQGERKAVSRFVPVKSAGDAPGDMSQTDGDDPRAMERWARQMGKELGEDLGDEFAEYVDDAADDD